MVLFAILLLMLAAFARDWWACRKYAFARDWWACRKYEAAWERVSNLHQEMIAQPGSATYGPEEVREAMGWRSRTGKPVAKDHYYEEVYELMRGLPWQRYYVCIIYQDVDGQPVYYAPFQGRMPDSLDVPTKPLVYEELLKASGADPEKPGGGPGEPEYGGGRGESSDGEGGDVKPDDVEAGGANASRKRGQDSFAGTALRVLRTNES
jgi:hypothetical protein